MLVYLCGAMSHWDRQDCFEKATDWREEAIKGFYSDSIIKWFNPCVNYFINKEYNSKGVVTQNLTYLKKSDIILLNLEELDKSPGSLFEIYYAYMNHIPVIAFGKNYLYGNQPHVTESISMHFDDMGVALDYIDNMFEQDNK